MKLILWPLCLMMILSSAWGFSPARVKPFQQFIDYDKFIQLSSEEQKAFIVSVMETVAEMEQELLEANKILTLDHEKRMLLKEKKKALNQLKEIFQQFSQTVALPDAYASKTNQKTAGPEYCPQATITALKDKHAKVGKEFVTCMYGTYMSNMVRDGKNYYCVRPACSGNKTFADDHNKAAQSAGCHPAQMVCNPALYGKDTTTGRASCVTLDFVGATPGSFENIAHNVSLACLMEVTNDPKSDERLNKIAKSITSPSNGKKEAASSYFNRMLSIITNVCLCGDVGFDGASLDSHESTFDKSYVGYMNGHRTCNALLSQMQLLTGKIAQSKNYCSDNKYLPNNLSELSENLQAFSKFSNRVNSYMQSSNRKLDSKNRDHRARAMRLLKERWVVSDGTNKSGTTQIVSAGQALDNIYTKKDLDPWIKAVCPLKIGPQPVEPLCVIEVKSQSRDTATVLTINATASVKNDKGEETDAELVWKLNEKPVHEKRKTLDSSLQVEAKDREFTLKAQTTVNGKKIECKGATFSSPIQPDPEKPSCTLSTNSGTFSVAGESLSLSPIPTHTTKPKELKGALSWYLGDKQVTPSALPATADTKEIVLTGKFKPEKGEEIVCGSVTFKKEEEETEPKPPAKCSINITSPAADTPKPADNKSWDISADLSLEDDQGEEVSEEAEVKITWSLDGTEVKGQSSTTFSGQSKTKAFKLSAKVNGFSCEAESKEDKPIDPPKPVPTKSCTLSLTQAPAGPALFSVEASVAPKPDDGSSVSFSGMSELKPAGGKSDVARGNIAGIAQSQKKTVTAKYKSGGADLECKAEIEIPAAQGEAPVNPQQQQPFMPPSIPDYMLQKRGVN